MVVARRALWLGVVGGPQSDLGRLCVSRCQLLTKRVSLGLQGGARFFTHDSVASEFFGKLSQMVRVAFARGVEMTLDQVKIVEIVIEVRPGRPAFSGQCEEIEGRITESA